MYVYSQAGHYALFFSCKESIHTTKLGLVSIFLFPLSDTLE